MNQSVSENTNEETTARTEHGQSRTVKSKLPKTHADYWASKLRKRTFTSKGKTVEIPTWQARFIHLGREQWYNTDTPNKATAAAKARDFYAHLLAYGWEPTLVKFKPGMVVSKDGATVGEFLSQIKALGGLSPTTREIYFKKFRSLVAGVCGIDGGKSKFDYFGGGRAAWLERVHAVKLERLTPDKVNQWKTKYLEAQSTNPIQHKRALITMNSILRSSKALFTEEIRSHLSVKLPALLPLDGVKNPKLPSMQYRSEIDPAALLQKAISELSNATGDGADDKHEMFKVIALSLATGLRRDEIDTLQCRHIIWAKNLIRVETTEHGAAKTASSEADISADPALLDLLKKHLPTPIFGNSFVIKSRVKPRPSAVSYHHYRCNRLFKMTNQWLKEQGITSIRAIHTCRKEFGSMINERGGIVAASIALRHSRIATTVNHYVDKRSVTVFPVAELMADTKVETINTKNAAKK